VSFGVQVLFAARTALVLAALLPGGLRAQWLPSGVTTGNIYYTNGNVGIGTISPASPLSVSGVINAGGNYYDCLTWTAYMLNNGIKIQTNIPYEQGAEMPTVIIEGYNYGATKTIGLMVSWYIYQATSGFLSYTASSFGGYAPQIQLADENGNVVIFINDRPFDARFTVRAFAYGVSEIPAWFNGWSAVDAAPGNADSYTVTVPYVNAFGGANFSGPVNLSGAVNVTGTAPTTFGGSVGIGTTSPSHTLSVAGTIGAQEVIVAASGADYVFQPGYRLPPLAEVADYVKANHHLPEIPSAKEVEEKGVSLGEMQSKLLAKIEELTLHMIRMQEQMDGLQRENRALWGEIGHK
jgi:hypothetical protein